MTVVTTNENSFKAVSSQERVEVEQLFASILKEMKKHGLPDVALLKRAYSLALQKHGGTRRKSEDLYITHPLEVAKILASYGHESDMVAAAILHDVVEDCDVSLEQIEAEFGRSIADIVGAVTKVSDLLVDDSEISKRDLDILSDVKFLTDISDINKRKAIYIKCADRIHNLKTIDVFPEEKKLAKAYHTRNIIIPAATKMHIHKLVEKLGSLCLQIENPRMYSEIKNRRTETINKNRDSLLGNEGLIETTRRMVLDENGWGRYVAKFEFHKRSIDSIHKELSRKQVNIYSVPEVISKKQIALYDVYFISKDTYNNTPETLFFRFYDKLHDSKYGLTIMGTDHMDDTDVEYYKLIDRYGNRYRLFVQSETEHLEFTHGIIVSDEIEDFRNGMLYVNKAEPSEPEHKMIPVFKKDGTSMLIDEGATVLDFAFAINPYIGLCTKYAVINDGNSQIPIYARLRPGDMVEIISDHDKNHPEKDIPHATVRWFEYVHTREATKTLSRWLEKHMDTGTPKMLVYDENGKKYEVEMASTVLDFAFAIGDQVGLHVQKAYVNKSTTPAPLDRVLRYEDRVRFEYDTEDESTPVFTWLSIVKTKHAKDILVNYFNEKYHA